MAQIANRTTNRLLDFFIAPVSGLGPLLAGLSVNEGVEFPALPTSHIRAQNVAAEIAEKSTAAKYPAVHLYCDKVTNDLREKFRTFSGKVRMVVEARVSDDRLDGLELRAQLLAAAITDLLDASRGDWGSGMFYTGGYEILFGPVKHGGKNFIQTNKISFEVDVSLN